MSILRVCKRENPFVQIDKSVAEDTLISWKAKGMMLYLLSRPDNWKIYVNQLSEVATDGREATRSAINELIERGYIVREQRKKPGGAFDGYDYQVFETPQIVESPVIGKPDDGKVGTNNKDRKDIDLNIQGDEPPLCDIPDEYTKPKPKEPRKVFTPPEPSEVEAYSREIGYPLNGTAWCDCYAQKGWLVGKAKMKDWKAAVRNWKANGWKPNGGFNAQQQKPKQEIICQ